MQKIVVGIIAVFFVQVGFQIYSAVSRTNYAYTSVAIEAPFAPGPLDRSAAPAYLANLYRASAPLVKAEALRSRPGLSVASNGHSQYQPVQAVERYPRGPGILWTANAIGPDIVITIPPPVRPAYSSTNTIVSSSVKREKKRSFFSKSLHVLKKPYDWLKAVAMKLD